MRFELNILYGILLLVNHFTYSASQKTCRPEFYKSDESPDGCESCDCYLEGSNSTECDINTGQCQCKHYMRGRRCEKFIEGFFCPSLDYHTYEAEYAEKLNDHSMKEDKVASYNERLWTGLGFVRVYNGAQLKFTIDNIKGNGYFDVILRYESNAKYPWQDVQFKLNSLSSGENKFCPQSGPYQTSFHLVPEKRNFLVTNSCFEKGHKYEITIEFYQFNKANQTVYWSELSKQDTQRLAIDSIVLLPRLTDDVFNEDLFLKELYMECREQFFDYSPSRSQYCVDGMCPITIYWIGLFECDCNKVGSVNDSCEGIQGACYCKANVYGQKCDKCTPKSWGFSEEGCQECHCNKDGSKSDVCDAETGQCSCHENIRGSTCDLCAPSYYGFPSCTQCNCNGHSTECDDRNGTCSNCQNHTRGDHCELCDEEYTGNPLANLTCTHICNCNSLGTELNDELNCDLETGDCRCLPNVLGTKCDKCKVDYWDFQSGKGCKSCDCDLTGVVNNETRCDGETGQCFCKKNKRGRRCEMNSFETSNNPKKLNFTTIITIKPLSTTTTTTITSTSTSTSTTTTPSTTTTISTSTSTTATSSTTTKATSTTTFSTTTTISTSTSTTTTFSTLPIPTTKEINLKNTAPQNSPVKNTAKSTDSTKSTVGNSSVSRATTTFYIVVAIICFSIFI